jgi:hypothetical protein
MTRKKTIIIIVGIFIIIILGIIGLFKTTSPAKKAVSQGTATIDPVSGEKVIQDSNLVQSNQLSSLPDQPTILGLNKLIDYGMGTDQQASVGNALNIFSTTRDPKIKQISLYQNSYTQKIDDTTGQTTFTFKMQADKKNDYYVVVTYTGSLTAVTNIYKADMTTLLFTQ